MKLSDVVGHERLVRQLRRALASGQPAHAYLLAGPAGIGKRTLAAAVVAGLLCEDPHDGDACGQCTACRHVAAGTHPDVRVVQREEGRRDVRTEQARELARWLGLRALVAARKVAVIEDAEHLNEHGQNALLKTLEEPPGATVLLLVATQASLLLPTVRSRCLRLQLDPLPGRVIDAFLETRGIGPEVRPLVVARAEGAPGRALALTEDPHADARRRMLDQLAGLASAAACDLSATAQALGKDDADVGLATAVTWYRDLLGLVAEGPNAPLRNPDVAPSLEEAAARISLGAILRALEVLCATIRAVERNANRTLALETTLLELRRLERGHAA
jgi:DNA polymerase-3 subunit delta'